jgi:SAM-dependent methyltransferase
MRVSLGLVDLRRIANSVGKRRGWNFSDMNDARDPVPWTYTDVVRRYLRPDGRILDVGTGGGEKLLSFADHVATAVGIDSSAEMVADARSNLAVAGSANVALHLMRAEKLAFDDRRFDVVLNRHSVVCVPEVVRVLRDGGIFITQQVGERNTRKICELFNCGVGGGYGQYDPPVALLAGQFSRAGCSVEVVAEYDVRYWFLDVESLVFWLQAIPMPEDFDVERHWKQVDRIIAEHTTAKGIETNEHRELLVVRKQ